MLKLVNIKKDYIISDNKTEALKGVDIEFRENEFVAVLGPSGCGKTTLLNIIGGLDNYTSGDLIINGKSTKKFGDADWDTYRNHSVGFVFQSYNLIPHQSVLSNVELALTLTGVSKAERKQRAKEALEKVGLADQLNKKPNQMSGGQMQRVAIARALVNNPDILLADEPTGALDSETSVQIMELLKEISKDKLVIMVTHNPELADAYSTRIIRLLDGLVTNDTNPYSSEKREETAKTKIKKPSMSFFTALSLSFNNLLTKKARTFLTSFAGSIGIIGIALILALSSGVDAYITKVEEDTLTSYPVMIEKTGLDINDFVGELMGNAESDKTHEKDKIYSNSIMTEMMTTMINGMSENNLEKFKSHLDKNSEINNFVSDIQYKYSTVMNIYTPDGYQVNPNTVFDAMGFKTESATDNPMGMGSMALQNTEIWEEMIDNDDLLKEQYEVIAGRFPEKYNEIVVIVDENNEISDYSLYALGLKDSEELTEMVEKAMNGEKLEPTESVSYTYDEILNLSFKLLVNTEYFEKQENGTYKDKSEDDVYILSKLDKAIDIDVVGILRANSKSAMNSAGGSVGYLGGLMTVLVNKVNASEIVNKQKEDPETDVFSGLPFPTDDEFTMDDINAYIATLPENEQMQYNGYIAQMKQGGMSDMEIAEKFESQIKAASPSSTYEENLAKLGVSELSNPSSIYIYPKDFASKDEISRIIDEYNEKADENEKINYTDYIGLMMSSVTTIINAISYILIAFVSISLVVSSIMIGIITYISVLERTKEIGILRAMGASKRDISRVFNAETLIIGFTAGFIGIATTLLLIIPINAIIEAITDIAGLAVLPTQGAIILVVISMVLTFIAGLIPSRIAAKKDPVTALRTE